MTNWFEKLLGPKDTHSTGEGIKRMIPEDIVAITALGKAALDLPENATNEQVNTAIKERLPPIVTRC